jgi:hypothetical protein
MHADRKRAARGPRAAALALGGLFGIAAAGIGGLWIAQGSLASPLASPEVLAAESVRALRAGDAAAAERALRRELAWGDRRASAWCRLAYARYSRTGRVDGEVEQALLKSYAIAPYDVDAFAWRLQFIFDHWQQVSPALRRHAMSEARAFHTEWPTRPVVETVIGQVRNPTGQFALRLAVRGAEPKPR